MSNSDLKIQIIRKVAAISDRTLLEEINKLVDLDSEIESVFELTSEQHKAIEKGLNDISEGRVYSSEKATKMMSHWLSK